MKLSEIKAAFVAGTLGKADFIDQMHVRHAQLFEYAAFIQGTDVRSIEVGDDSVIITMRASGVKIACDPVDKRTAPVEALNFGSYEHEHCSMILDLIKPEDVVFDIGSNIGWYSLNIARRYPKSSITAFEPIPRTFEQLQRNIGLNNFANIRAFNFGLSDRPQELKFYYERDCSGRASAANLSERSDLEVLVCTVKRLDDIAADLARLDFIKCDCEGAELFVFKGGLETIKRLKPMIFSEMLRKWSAKFNYHPNQIIELLAGIGYQCFTSKDGKLKVLSRVDENTADTNFFFLDPLKHAEVIRSRA